MIGSDVSIGLVQVNLLEPNRLLSVKVFKKSMYFVTDTWQYAPSGTVLRNEYICEGHESNVILPEYLS